MVFLKFKQNKYCLSCQKVIFYYKKRLRTITLYNVKLYGYFVTTCYYKAIKTNLGGTSKLVIFIVLGCNFSFHHFVGM